MFDLTISLDTGSDEPIYSPTFHLTEYECHIIEAYLQISQRNTAAAAVFFGEHPELPELLKMVGER